MSEIPSVGDRVMVCDNALAQQMADQNHPITGRVIEIRSGSLVWVRDFLGHQWGLPAHQLRVMPRPDERGDDDR